MLVNSASGLRPVDVHKLNNNKMIIKGKFFFCLQMILYENKQIDNIETQYYHIFFGNAYIKVKNKTRLAI